jgi:hypothetical protein
MFYAILDIFFNPPSREELLHTVCMKYHVDLCDNVVKKRGEYLVCNSTRRFAYKERKRMVYDCQDTNLDLEVIVQHPKVIKHCV